MDRLVVHLKTLGRKAFFLIDRALFDPMSRGIAASLDDDIAPVFERFGGECCFPEIERVTTLIKAAGSEIIVALGG